MFIFFCLEERKDLTDNLDTVCPPACTISEITWGISIKIVIVVCLHQMVSRKRGSYWFNMIPVLYEVEMECSQVPQKRLTVPKVST